MHELSISSAIVDTALRHAGGRPVTAVQMRVGALRQVVPESLDFYFEIVARDTPCEGATLELEIVPALMSCQVCGCEWDPAPEPELGHEPLTAVLPTFRCPGCELAGAQVVRGRRARGRVDRGRGRGPRASLERRPMHRTKIRVAEDALDANQTIANANRHDFDHAGVAVVNMMSAPGAGKTTLLERGLDGLEGVRAGVLEGDVQGTMDADRIAAIHVPVVQLNTDSGFGGECHLDANMVRSAIGDLPLDELDLLMIENVGNLVCPAEFKVGEDARIMVTSVTEGEDKPLKYPLMFRACELVIINKLDLLPHVDFDLDRMLANIDAVNPGVETMLVSATSGRGVDEWREWLTAVPARVAAGASV